MEYNTFNVNQLKRFAQSDEKLALVRKRPPTGGDALFELFDRYKYPYVSLERCCSLFLHDICPEILEREDFLPDAEWSRYCDTALLQNLLDKQRLITAILLQSAPNHRLKLSWAWRAEDENPVIVGSTGDGSGRVSVEGTIAELLRTLWARFLGSLRRLEDLVLSGYDASARAISRATKKMVTDTGGRSKVEQQFVEKIDRRKFSEFLIKESSLAERSLKSIISYEGTAGLRRSSRDWKRQRQILNQGDMSYRISFSSVSQDGDNEYLLVACIRQFCFNLVIKDSFVSRRLFSDHVCCLGRQLFPEARFVKIIADQGLSYDVTASDVVQAMFFSLRGWLIDDENRILVDVEDLINKVRKALLTGVKENRNQLAATDPSILSSKLLAYYGHSSDYTTDSVRLALVRLSSIATSGTYFAFA